MRMMEATRRVHNAVDCFSCGMNGRGFLSFPVSSCRPFMPCHLNQPNIPHGTDAAAKAASYPPSSSLLYRPRSVLLRYPSVSVCHLLHFTVYASCLPCVFVRYARDSSGFVVAR